MTSNLFNVQLLICPPYSSQWLSIFTMQCSHRSRSFLQYSESVKLIILISDIVQVEVIAWRRYKNRTLAGARLSAQIRRWHGFRASLEHQHQYPSCSRSGLHFTNCSGDLWVSSFYVNIQLEAEMFLCCLWAVFIKQLDAASVIWKISYKVLSFYKGQAA